MKPARMSCSTSSFGHGVTHRYARFRSPGKSQKGALDFWAFQEKKKNMLISQGQILFGIKWFKLELFRISAPAASQMVLINGLCIHLHWQLSTLANNPGNTYSDGIKWLRRVVYASTLVRYLAATCLHTLRVRCCRRITAAYPVSSHVSDWSLGSGVCGQELGGEERNLERELKHGRRSQRSEVDVPMCRVRARCGRKSAGRCTSRADGVTQRQQKHAQPSERVNKERGKTSLQVQLEWKERFCGTKLKSKKKIKKSSCCRIFIVRKCIWRINRSNNKKYFDRLLVASQWVASVLEIQPKKNP